MHLMITAFTRIFFVRVLGIDQVIPIMIAALALGIFIPIVFFNLTNRAGLWWLYTFRKKDRIPVYRSEPLVGAPGLLTPKTSIRKDKTIESN